ncbi:shikimate kinase [Sporolactobacillus kofuensis]|uniref:Shikimate kinase n=1 Tax=Sporolactobacillus kofuensis TaxID=269672 RepID=A0ABW1WEN7_9BACL|nr:shikimate kinase [Sporolactobacillus kofuensis]MCO7175218.1 shikimate kinase [Sporolactobacillus kofuensis]
MVEAILTGFMGSGKTTIGKLLARTAHCTHLDLDDLIVKYAKKTINQLFAEQGEKYFRDLETELLVKVLEQPGILSTGGGTIGSVQNRQLLEKNTAPVIYLKTSLDSVICRLHGDNTRPLFQSYAAFFTLYQRRMYAYEQSADFTIITDNKSPARIAEEIQSLLTFEHA